MGDRGKLEKMQQINSQIFLSLLSRQLHKDLLNTQMKAPSYLLWKYQTNLPTKVYHSHLLILGPTSGLIIWRTYSIWIFLALMLNLIQKKILTMASIVSIDLLSKIKIPQSCLKILK